MTLARQGRRARDLAGRDRARRRARPRDRAAARRGDVQGREPRPREHAQCVRLGRARPRRRGLRRGAHLQPGAQAVRQAAGELPDRPGTPRAHAGRRHRHAALLPAARAPGGGGPAVGHDRRAGQVPQHAHRPRSHRARARHARRQRRPAGEPRDPPHGRHRGAPHLRGHRDDAGADRRPRHHRDRRLCLVSAAPRTRRLVPIPRPRRRDSWNTALWIVQGLLAAIFLATGLTKLTQPRAKMAAGPMRWAADVTDAQFRAIGALEVLGAIGLIVPAALGVAPILTAFAAVGLVLTMVAAIAIHRRLGETEPTRGAGRRARRSRSSSPSSASAPTASDRSRPMSAMTSAPAPLWPATRDLTEIERVPLEQRGLPASSYHALLRAAELWPQRPAIHCLPDAERWEQPVSRSVRRAGGRRPSRGVGLRGLRRRPPRRGRDRLGQLRRDDHRVAGGRGGRRGLADQPGAGRRARRRAGAAVGARA